MSNSLPSFPCRRQLIQSGSMPFAGWQRAVRHLAHSSSDSLSCFLAARQGDCRCRGPGRVLHQACRAQTEHVQNMACSITRQRISIFTVLRPNRRARCAKVAQRLEPKARFQHSLSKRNSATLGGAMYDANRLDWLTMPAFRRTCNNVNPLIFLPR